jgi:hypothetical protein
MGNNAKLVDAIAKSCAGLGAQVILSLKGAAAARIAYSGVGEVWPVANCRRELLRPLVQRVRAQVSYR